MYYLASKRSLLAAVALAVGFVLFQAWTAGYGTKINQLSYIRDYKISPDALTGSALDRPFIVDRERMAPENLDKWMLRFKLYSVDADEMVTLMALARMHPERAELDPHMYQYGGAWLYPLGAWFAALNATGILHAGSLTSMVDRPDRMNKVYWFGRLFVALAVGVSGVFLFAAIREAAPPTMALAGEALFFLCPATISFSLTMKPHWYALVFVSPTLFLLTRVFIYRRLASWSEVLLGILIGLAVGCAVSFGSFAVLAWLGLALLAWRRSISPWTLVRVPLIAVAAFMATNPFLFLNHAAAQSEAAQTAGWFTPALNWAALSGFFWNSLLPGFGVALTAALMAGALREIARPTCPGSRLLAAGIWIALALAASLTANLVAWNVNYRYVAYALPAAILLLMTSTWPLKEPVVASLLVLTVLQSVPLKLAMADENSIVHGTRLAAANWIDSQIPGGSGVCVGTATPAPFNTPPFNFGRFAINAPTCRFLVRVEPPEVDHATPPGFDIAKRFRPSLSTNDFALVFGHVNPQITVYRRK